MTPGEIDQLAASAADWIAQQRNLHRPNAFKMTEVHRQLGITYFEKSDLDAVRILVVSRISNPPFHAAIAARLEAEGVPVHDFNQGEAITFIDTILVSRDAPGSAKSEDQLRALLFHEMIHVVQYRILGLEDFADQYIHGWVNNGFKYTLIPLEVQAFSLGERALRGEQFRAETILRQMLRRA